VGRGGYEIRRRGKGEDRREERVRDKEEKRIECSENGTGKGETVGERRGKGRKV
jgi:hypothetical protein